MKRAATLSLFGICLFLATTAVSAQTNLLLNPDADQGLENWRVYGDAKVEELDGAKVFVVRNGGISNFNQDVDLSESDVGKYALLIGRGSSERLNEDGAITGLPDLYGCMLKSRGPDGAKINTYLQGQKMLPKPSSANEWVTMFGIFPVPKGTVAIRFFLMQAERNGVPQNGSAARFDNLGLFLFETQEEALNFAKAYDKKFSSVP
jgi:hypothetical protein